MELRHLRTFTALSEIKNFTKTAEQLHYAQSYVTTQIQQLEEELNVRLFERIGKAVSLTPDGTALLPYARQMLNLSREIKLRFANQETGRITIGASESICLCRLPQLITAFQRKYPNIELYLNVLDTTDIASQLAGGAIDLAFVLDTPVCHASLHTACRIEEPICVCALPDHPLAQKAEVLISDFSDIPLIVTAPDCCYRKPFSQDLSNAGITPNIVLETSSVQVIKQTAISGLGLCILPHSFVREEIAHGVLKILNFNMSYDIESQLIYHKDKWISDYLRKFIDMARELTLAPPEKPMR